MSLPQPYDEKQLLKKISGGNEKAFRTLYDAYIDRLSIFTFKLCKSKTIAEEIVQDIFLKLWTNRADLLYIDAPEAYIFTMARNKTIDHLRRLAKETGLLTVLTEQIQASNNEIDEKLDAEALRQLIETAVSQLSTQKQQVFQLSRHEGLSHDEIAERMQLSKSTVKNHLSETLKHIREHISQQPNPEVLLLLFAFTALQ